MDTQEQIFGLVESAQQQQAAVNEALTRLARMTAALQEASVQAVPAVRGAAAQGVAIALGTASKDATAAVMAATKHLADSLWKGVHATDIAEFRLSKAAELFDRSVVSMRWRHVAMLSVGAAGCIVVVLIAGWISLTWQRDHVSDLREEKATLTAEVADLAATATKLTAKGGRAALTMCGTDAQTPRLCVKVIDGKPYGGESGKETFYIISGY